MKKNEELKDSLGGKAGWARRDALKAVAMLAAARLAAQTGGTAQVPAGRSGAVAAGKRDQLFDDGWRFLRDDAPGAEQPGFDDASWRILDLPHDFSVEDLPPRAADANGEGAIWGNSVTPTRVGPFDAELSAGGRSTGWFVGGTGWYRKRFPASAVPAGGQVEIVFDGVYMVGDVWLNGKLLGNHPYGYTSFAYDLTPYLRREGENVIAVRVRNEGRNTRWYSGSGIYRHVWLNTTGSVRVPLWSLFVTTQDASPDNASVKVAVQIENRARAAQEVTARIRLFDPRNASAGAREVRQSLAAGASADVEQVFAVASPQLWSPDSPRLYRAEVELLAGGSAADTAATSFGIRKVEVDAQRGLRINGESVKLKGGCLHHDNGLLGACTIDRAEERRVELMKAHGFNAIRTAHNPPSPAFLSTCDRLGILVVDEAFDVWEVQKNPQDYHLYFGEWWRRDLSSMVMRDRNHPSVIIWSIANEVPERVQPRGVEIGKQMKSLIRTLDTTRPVMVAVMEVSGGGGQALDPGFEYADIAGYQYLPHFYESDHVRHPDRVMVGSESFPRQVCQNLVQAKKNAFVIGDFVWTGMDHLGEAAIGNAQLSAPARGRGGPGAAPAAPAGAGMMISYPWFVNYSGDIDLTGQAKPQWYHRRVAWGLSQLEMAVQRPVPPGRTEVISGWGWSDELRSWTWPGSEGKTVKVRVYSSGDQVRLLLNGKEIGVKPVSFETDMGPGDAPNQPSGLIAEFETPYEPGELKAVALSKGQPIAELFFKTVGRPAKLRLTADRASIRRDRNDLSYVTVEVVDQAGELVPDAVVPVSLSVSGAAELAAAGSASPKDVESFRRTRPKTFHGRCLAIVRPKGAVGTATVRAQADGLAPASIMVRVS